MKKLLLIVWFCASALLLLLAIALGYLSVMMGTVHWDWWLAGGLGACFLAIGVCCLWMCRRAYRLLKPR
ncbi:MAG TPA: hypothetical protein VGQ35_14075 [Dongiaceae bacterium]|nr:hypothetical protein [Dongiaceae bacterium]